MKSLNNKVGFIYNDAKIQRVGKGRKMMEKKLGCLLFCVESMMGIFARLIRSH